MTDNPSELKWVKGPLPPVESVPNGGRVIAWLVHRRGHKPKETPDLHKTFQCVFPPEWEGRFKRITMAYPEPVWNKESNPLRWVDAAGYPIEYEEEVTWWAWV